MLNELHIENIAVIERAEIRFTGGLNVLTGETGAGKSIVIDAIGAVLGGRVSRELVRQGAEKGLVSAVFDSAPAQAWLEENDIEADDGELILQRRIGSDGKSACRVCGTPVTAAQMKDLGALLVDIHGQNDGRLLMDERLHQGYLDRFGALEGELGRFQGEYGKYTALRKEIRGLSMDEIEKERLSDSLQAQIQELEVADLKAGEKESLSARRDLLRNAEKLTEALDTAYEALYGGEENAVTLSQNASYYVNRAAALAPELEAAAKGIDEAVFGLTDAAELLRDFRAGLDFSPEEYDRLESRIAQINRLERKYGRDEEALPGYLDACRARLEELQYADDRLEKLQKELQAQVLRCRKAAEALGQARQKAAAELERRIVRELRELNMPSVRFAVEFEPVEAEPGFDAQGGEKLRFLMSANAGEELGRISRIASGGELSRIMLAMKNVFAEKDPVSTLIFDEIDTGVSGIAAQRVGEKLFSVSKGKQVLCVTHLPQIAAMADNHYLISKEERQGRTYTQVDRLDRQGRRRELARLHGGEHVTELTLLSAEEQLKAAEAFKRSGR